MRRPPRSAPSPSPTRPWPRPRLRAVSLLLVAIVLCCSVLVGPAIAGAGAGAGAGVGAGVGVATVETTEMTHDEDSDRQLDPVSVDTELQSTDGPVEVVVSLTPAELPPDAPPERVRAHLETHAATTQRAVLAYANETDGVTVENRFWLTNAVLLEIDTASVDLESFGRFDAVRTVHANFDVRTHESAAAPPGESTVLGTAGAPEATYGLDQIRAPEVWDAYDTRGEGVSVAVLDTGVDVTHPDIDLYRDDPTDESYAGGWAEFDRRGDEIRETAPSNDSDHGTHVSGTVAGANHSGTAIGVAPDATLLHGNVLGSNGRTFASVIGGMQWAVERDADVISMSLGPADGGYVDALLEPIRNAKQQDVVVVGSIGNDGAGTTGTPGNSYDTIGVGAVDSSADVAWFSGGEKIVTADVWETPPADWPETYVAPEVTAPGYRVYSAVPGGTYDRKSGTSMAAPHVAGAVALLRSVHEDATPAEIETALSETAWKPAGEPSEQDTRYGHGIVDVRAAMDTLAPATVAGTVTDETGAPLEDATVSIDGQWETTTAADGSYDLAVDAGDRSIAIDAPGYDGITGELTALSTRTVHYDASLESHVSISVHQTQPAVVESAENATVTAAVDVEQADELSVSLGANTTLDPESLELSVDGTDATFDERVAIDPGASDGSMVVAVTVEDGTNGTLELVTTAADAHVERTAAMGSTSIVPKIYDVGVVASADDAAGDRLRETLESRLSAAYRLSQVDPTEAADSANEYDVVVALELSDEDGAVEAFLEATAGDIGVVYLGTTAPTDGLVRYQAVTGSPPALGQDDGSGTGFEAGTLRMIGDRTHPLLEGVTLERESVRVLENASSRVWFDDGTESDGDRDTLETIASVTTDGVLADGGGLALNPAQRQILFAATPRDGTLTAAGERAIGNAVAYLGAGTTYVSEDFETYGVSGETETAVFGVSDAGNATVSVTDATTIDRDAIELSVDGTPIEPGETIVVPDSLVANGLAVNATVAAGVEGVVQLALETDGDGDGKRVTTTPIEFRTHPPARYEGTVAVNGQPARDGLTLHAVVDGEPVGETTIEDGRFGVPDSSGGPLEVSRATDTEVEFVLEGVATSTAQPITWEPGDERRLAVSVTYDDPFENATIEAPAWTLEGDATTLSVTGYPESLVTDVDWTVGDRTATGQSVSRTFDDRGDAHLSATLTALGGESYTLEDWLYVTEQPPITVSGQVADVSSEASETNEMSETTEFVHIAPDDAGWIDVATVDDDGRFAGLGLENRTHHVTLVRTSAVDGLDRWGITTVTEERFATDTDLGRLNATEWHTLEILVTDDEGAPVEGATVEVTPVDEPERFHHRLEGTTSADGAFVPDGAAADTVSGLDTNGTVTVTVRPPTDDSFLDGAVSETRPIDADATVTVSLETVADERDGGNGDGSDGSGGGGSAGGGFGGGGTGGGIADLPPSFTLESTTESDGSAVVSGSDAVPGATASTTFDDVGTGPLSLTDLSLTAATDRPSFAFTVRPGDRGTAPELETGSVSETESKTSALAYFTIDHDGLDDAFEAAAFRYTIDETTLPDGVDPAELALYRYHDGEWTPLDTRLTDGTYRATASGPGFSTFAVGVDDRTPALTVVDGSVTPTSVVPGETVQIEATVENTGDAPGSQHFVFRADGDHLESVHRTVAPGTRETIAIETTLDSVAPTTNTNTSATTTPSRIQITLEGEPIGTVTVHENRDSRAKGADSSDEAAAEDSTASTDGDAGTRVTSSADGSSESNGTDDGGSGEPAEPDSVPGFGSLSALLAVVVAVLLADRRRR